LLRCCCDNCVHVVETIDIINVTKDCRAPARARHGLAPYQGGVAGPPPRRRATPNSPARPKFAPPPSPPKVPAPGGPSDVGPWVIKLPAQRVALTQKWFCDSDADFGARVLSHFCVTLVLRHAAILGFVRGPNWAKFSDLGSARNLANGRIPALPRGARERQESTFSGRSGPRPWTPQLVR
jgi:hypothetical protein